MYLSNGMNNFPFQHIPPGWFIRRREHLETYYHELTNLKDKVTRFASHQNVVALLNAVESLNQLDKQIEAMADHLASNLRDPSDAYDCHNMGDLRRIRELSTATSTELEAIAGKISWGIEADSQISQVTRNLYPLLNLIEETLNWLEQGIDS